MDFYVLDGTLVPHEDDEQAIRTVKKHDGKILHLAFKGHSTIHANLVFKFLDYLQATYGHGVFENREAMRYYISIKAGHCQVVVKILENGESAKVLEALSWSQPECSQEQFMKLSRAVDEFAMERYGLTMDTWKQNRRTIV